MLSRVFVCLRSLRQGRSWASLNRCWLGAGVALAIFFNAQPGLAASDLQLPDLGDAGGGVISPAQEYELGQKVLRIYRSNLPISSDPFYEVYLAQLLQRIVTYSPLQDKRLEILVIDNPTLNAFAAPGGIVGVNTGTFLIANTEPELASILSHELAHLSQRHYVRGQQKQATNAIASVAGILGGIILGAAAGADAGMAAITAVQAGALDARLRFSRELEQEADRIGMQTLVAAGYDAHAMPDMFEIMQNNSRYRTKVPEFLLTHPLTESRIADSKARAQQYPRRPPTPDVEFQILRARAMFAREENAQFAVKRFSEELKGNTLPSLTARYGLALALIKADQPAKAHQVVEELAKDYPNLAAITVARADVAAASRDLPRAIDILQTARKAEPHNHIYAIRLAELLMEAIRYPECEKLLTEHIKQQPKSAYTWYLLAEVHGLAGHILELHKARAEYFILHGIYDKAEIQLRNALRLVGENFQGRSRIEQRLIDVKTLQREKLDRA